MEIPITLKGFDGHAVALHLGGIFSSAELLVDGVPVRPKKGIYTLTDVGGQSVRIKFKTTFLDPVPNLDVDGQVIQIARPLHWYEYLWMGLPILLIISGGALGGVCGAIAAYANARVFRSDRGSIQKYALTGLFGLTALVGWLIIATVFQLVILHG